MFKVLVLPHCKTFFVSPFRTNDIDRGAQIGLQICQTIKLFCSENPVAMRARAKHVEKNPDFNGQIVDMRVGIHSGRVIYGIVGGKRYKFDVYSKGNYFSRSFAYL